MTRSPARGRLIAVCAIALGVPGSVNAQTPSIWVIDGVEVGLPPAPNGESWDTATAGILTFNLRNIQPDIQVCLESPHVPGQCLPVCQDAGWSNESNTYQCSRSLRPQGGLFLEENVHVQVREIDSGSFRTVADLRIADPTTCNPCTQALPGGTLTVAFSFAKVTAYTGPFRGNRGVIAPAAAPSAPVASTAATPPEATGPSLWERAKNYGKQFSDWLLRWKDPGGIQGNHDIAQEAAEASRLKSVLKLSQIAREHGLQSRMPLCASAAAAEKESCLLSQVLGQSEAATGEALAYLRGPHVQEQIDDLAKAKARDVLCSWYGFDVCQFRR